MASSSGSKFFFWFIFLCFGVSGYLILKKYIPIGLQKDQNDLSALFLTPEDACFLLYANVDERAEYMVNKKNVEKYQAADGSNIYHYYFSGKQKIIIPPNQDYYYYISFPERKSYEKFTEQFEKYKKLGESPLCRERYEFSSKCVVCAMRFKSGIDCNRVLIMKNQNTEQSIKQVLECY